MTTDAERRPLFCIYGDRQEDVAARSTSTAQSTAARRWRRRRRSLLPSLSLPPHNGSPLPFCYYLASLPLPLSATADIRLSLSPSLRRVASLLFTLPFLVLQQLFFHCVSHGSKRRSAADVYNVAAAAAVAATYRSNQPYFSFVLLSRSIIFRSRSRSR